MLLPISAKNAAKTDADLRGSLNGGTQNSQLLANKSLHLENDALVTMEHEQEEIDVVYWEGWYERRTGDRQEMGKKKREEKER